MNTELVNTPPSIAIADRVRELSQQGVKVAKLQTGEPAFDTPAYIVEAAYDAMKAGHTHYSASQGLPELRESISKHHIARYGTAIEPARIVIHNGGIHAVYCVLSAVLSPGDEVLIPEPYWPQYKYISLLNDALVKGIDTRAQSGRLTPGLLENAMSESTRVVVLNNPSNPAGIVYNEHELAQFLAIAKKNDAYILFDEVYSEIAYSNAFASVMSLRSLQEYQEQILYVNSFSKTYAMTGWRIGYSILPRHAVGKVLKVLQNTITNTNTFCQRAAVTAIDKRDENNHVFEDMLSTYSQRLRELKAILIKKNIEFIEPHGAFYYFIKCNRSSLEFANELLEKHHIAVVPGSAYGEYYDDYFRISYAVDEYSYNAFLNWLEQSSDEIVIN